MDWVRGDTIGRGSFGTVNLAFCKTNYPQNSTPIVVKSSQFSDSIHNEGKVLSELGNNHPQIIKFLGSSLTSENNTQFYNLFFEYATKGSLADQLRISGVKFRISDVKRYTKSILKGLYHVHEKGFAHCDIKLQNILLFDDGAVKIADFGLAKRKTGDRRIRGTPLYMSPEIVAGGEVESPADIWALGCVVIEMVTGKPAWNFSPDYDVSALLFRIGILRESPEIPVNLCSEGKDFLGKCFVKDPSERWTAQMLLDHPFLSGSEDPCCLDNYDQQPSVSPKCPFDFPDWDPLKHSGLDSDSDLDYTCSALELEVSCRSSVSGRLVQLVTDRVPDWGDSDWWVPIR